jgi:thiol-disulfide isomerase/thioredoxin
MKKEFLMILLVLFLFSGCRTSKPVTETMTVTQQAEEIRPVTNFSEQSTWLLGYFAKDQLTRPPYSEWYMKGYDEYQLNADAVNKLTDISKNNITIKIVLGTWCPDSRREVPRFMRILDVWQFPSDKVTFIGVDNVKLSPVGEYEKLDIQRVPTFIFYRNNIESGRIIENPVTSLEQDIVNILTRNE